MNYFAYRRAKWFGVAADAAINYTEHDKRYHHGNYDPSTMTCEMREAEAKGDLVDVLNAEEEEASLFKQSAKKRKAEKKEAKKEEARHRSEKVIEKTISDLTTREYSDRDRELVNDAIRHVLNEPPYTIPTEEAAKDARSLRSYKGKEVMENIADFFEKRFPYGIEAPWGGNIEVNRSSAKSIVIHSSRHGLGLPILTAICHIGELAKAAKVFAVNPKWKGRTETSISMAAPMRIGDHDKVVEITIIKNAQGRQELYNVKVVRKEEVEERDLHDAAISDNRVNHNNFSTTAHSIPNSSAEVNRHITEKSEMSEKPKIPASNLVKQYLAANGLLGHLLQK